MGILTVNLLKMSTLKDDKSGHPDPYVIFELEKNKLKFDKAFGERTSTVKSKEIHPVYNEIFTYNDIPELNGMDLNVTVMDKNDTKDRQIANLKVKLDDPELALASGNEYEGCWLLDKTIFVKRSRIYFTLHYVED